jgi:FtsP/CotA-like multicopper oxidase with cupredoxin domain
MEPLTARILTRRRAMATGAAALGTGALLLRADTARAAQDPTPSRPDPAPPGEPGKDYTPVTTPNGVSLPWKLVDGVKVFHLIAEEVDHEFAPGLRAKCWGYNGRVHGPTIEAVEGDRVRIYVTNRLPEPTSVHWHGLLVPNGMDGVGGLTQKGIPAGQTYRYEFTLRQHGTQMYHPHFDEMVQMGMGMMGLFVIHPRTPDPSRLRAERDFALLLSEWRLRPGASRPDPSEMTEFNLLTINGKAFPGTDPLVVRKDQPLRIRIGNLSAMDHHPIHLHGHRFQVVATDAGTIPSSARWPETTVLVPVGNTRDIEFVADNPGDWPVHCHMTHHMMNQMGHGLPNLLGMDAKGLDQKIGQVLPEYMTMGHKGMGAMARHMQHMPQPPNSIPMRGADGPFGYIDMGGMFTILKVREGIQTYEDPGWYEHPEGTVASEATRDELSRDAIHEPAPEGR